MGEGSLPTGGYDGTEEAWAAIIDVPNGWVQIGSYQKEAMENSCMNSIRFMIHLQSGVL